MTTKLAAFIAAGTLATLSAPSLAQSVSTPSLVGSWTESVSIANSSASPALVTFGVDGTATDTFLLDFSGANATPGHGIWQSTGATTASVKIQKILTTTATAPGGGSYYGGADIVTATVNVTGQNSFSATGTIKLYTASGALAQSLPFTASGTRITLP